MPRASKFTEKEIDQIRQMAQVRLPVEQMASILGISKNTFERRLKKDAVARGAMEKSRDGSSLKVRATLYQMAVGTKADPQNGRLAVSAEFQALKFWCQTQEGFKTADRLELSGVDGRPIETVELTPEQAMANLKKINERVKVTEDE